MRGKRAYVQSDERRRDTGMGVTPIERTIEGNNQGGGERNEPDGISQIAPQKTGDRKVRRQKNVLRCEKVTMMRKDALLLQPIQTVPLDGCMRNASILCIDTFPPRKHRCLGMNNYCFHRHKLYLTSLCPHVPSPQALHANAIDAYVQQQYQCITKYKILLHYY